MSNDEELTSKIAEYVGMDKEDVAEKIVNMSLQEITRMVSLYRSNDKDAVFDILSGKAV